MKSKKSEQCRRGGHKDRDRMILRGFDEPHDRECFWAGGSGF